MLIVGHGSSGSALVRRIGRTGARPAAYEVPVDRDWGCVAPADDLASLLVVAASEAMEDGIRTEVQFGRRRAMLEFTSLLENGS